MSRNTKWKLEKTKVKVVFRLQFQATHIPQTGWNNLFISFIPSDSGKATAKTNKAIVRNGTCKWADPIYESTRLLQDSKTKQYEEKFYKFVVGMGTSRSSLLGEANINLSDYVDALKPIVAALPLHGSDNGAILHVTVQLLTSKTGFREFEQQREVSDRGLHTNSDNDCGKPSMPGESVVSRAEKVSSRVRFKPEPKELPSLEEESGFSEEYADSAAGFDGSSNTSGSLYTEKHDTSSSREIDSVKSTVSGDFGGVSPTQSPTTNIGPSGHRFQVPGTRDWVHHLGAENSGDSEMAIAYEENSRLRGALEAADMSIHELRQEISSLKIFADGVGVEAQRLTEQLAVEVSSQQVLANEVSLLKSECSRFKDDLDWLRNLKMNPPIPRRKIINVGQYDTLQDVSLRCLNGFSDMEDKISQLQIKVRVGSDGSDLSFLHSDLEALLGIVQDLKRGTEHSLHLLDQTTTGKASTNISEKSSAKTDHVMSDTGLGVELCNPEGVLLPGLLAPGAGSVDATNAMQGEIFKLLRELDDSKAERESLVRKMDQMECYYEALIQELEENQKQILGELQNLRNEHSTCIYTVTSTKAQMEALHQQMNEELLRLAEERCNLNALNKELERRAVTSEAALRRARLNYSIAVNQLQKDLEVLSLQVLSMYETNENLVREAFSVASQPVVQDCQEDEFAGHITEGSIVDKLIESERNSIGLESQHARGNRLLEDLQRSLTWQEELYRKIQEELSEMHLANIHLEVFSVTLHQALLEAALDSKLAKAETDDYAKQLELSSRANESMKLKLQNLTDEICTLTDEKACFVSRCNDLGLENQLLEANLKTLSDEKHFLSEKTWELEMLVTEYGNYKSKYESCAAEREKLSNVLEQAAAEKGHLGSEVSLLQGEVMALKIKVGEMENIQKIINHLRERLTSLLESGDERFDYVVSCSRTVERSTEDQNREFEEFSSIVVRLEECQRNFNDKILQLTEQKKDLLYELDVARASLASAESEAEVVKQKLQYEVPDMVSKFNASSALVEKLQTDLEVVSDRLKVSSEAEEKNTQMTRDLLSDFTKVEAALQELTSKNEDLAMEIMAFQSYTDDLEGNKKLADKVTQENLSLTLLLQNKTSECDMLTEELNNLRATTGSLQEELSLQRGIRDQVEAEISNLKNQMKQRDEKLAHLEQEEAELDYLKQQLLDVELENSSLHFQLSHLDAQLKKALEECSSTNIEIQLLDMHQLLVAADVAHIVVAEQYKLHVEELLRQLTYYHQHLEEVDKSTLDLSFRLSNCLSSKENYVDENARLLSDLELKKCKLESSVALNRALEHSNSSMATELRESKENCDLVEARYAKAKAENEFEIAELKCLIRNSESEICDLMFSKEELEIRFLVLLEKVTEMSAQVSAHGECGEQLARLQRQCSELSRKLSEQNLKTEEFKNLSIHLKELKDKADAEHLQAHEKKEAEGSSVAMQESLRIAFIKEQYETKLQEVRHQLSISKKHGEEMLWKLQDALNEIENGKKCEASQLKRNDELLLKITELEEEIQSALSENREKFMAYEQLKAELDCSVMSLDCCKEEKKQLMQLYQESSDEKGRLADEAELMREQLENLKAFMRRPVNEDDGFNNHNSLNGSYAVGNLIENRTKDLGEGGLSNSSDDQGNHLVNNMNANSAIEDGEEMNPRAVQEALSIKATEELSALSNCQNDGLQDNAKHEASLGNQLKPQNILSSIDRLQKELERMRNDNTFLPGDENPDEVDSKGFRYEQVHLEKVTQELGNMSSLYKGSSRSGNTVERVLALELELAEALQANKKSSIQFQSSFLKLHNDEAAVFQSFRDINELIKDMLEMKERYDVMETELKGMHDRYSQMSLDFAEVEGERQKLMMMLKNVRSSKRLLSQSPSSNHEELSP